jgi:hypothetical protein
VNHIGPIFTLLAILAIVVIGRAIVIAVLDSMSEWEDHRTRAREYESRYPAADPPLLPQPDSSKRCSGCGKDRYTFRCAKCKEFVCGNCMGEFLGRYSPDRVCKRCLDA